MLLSFMEGWNLIPVYIVVTFIAVGLCLDNMNLRAVGRLGTNDDLVFHWLHRLSLLVLGLTFLLSLSYAADKGWQPWAPDLVMRVAIVVWLAVSSVAVRFREKNIILFRSRRFDRGWGFDENRQNVKGLKARH